MPENDKVITVIHEWVIKAENDLKVASHILKLGEECLLPKLVSDGSP